MKKITSSSSFPIILCEDDRPRVGLAVPVVFDRDGAEDDLVGAANLVLLECRPVRRRLEVLGRVAQVVSQPAPEKQ